MSEISCIRWGAGGFFADLITSTSMNPSSSAVGSSRTSKAEGAGVPALAIASLVLGVFGLLTSILLVGGVLALVGLILGIRHLRRRSDGRRMGWAGVTLSSLALVISLAVGGIILNMRQFIRAAEGSRQPGFQQWYGKASPDLELATLDGGVVRLSELRGRRVVLDFWASWNRHSRRKVPHLIQLQQEVPEQDLAIVAVSGEERGVLNTFVAEQGINYTVACSGRGNLPKPYSDIEMLPTTFYIDRNGTIQHVSVGYRDYESIRRNATAPDLPMPVEPAVPESETPP